MLPRMSGPSGGKRQPSDLRCRDPSPSDPFRRRLPTWSSTLGALPCVARFRLSKRLGSPASSMLSGDAAAVFVVRRLRHMAARAGSDGCRFCGCCSMDDGLRGLKAVLRNGGGHFAKRWWLLLDRRFAPALWSFAVDRRGAAVLLLIAVSSADVWAVCADRLPSAHASLGVKVTWLAPLVWVARELCVPYVFPWYLSITQAWVPTVIQIADITDRSA